MILKVTLTFIFSCFLLRQQARNNFCNNFEVCPIFQCVMKRFYLFYFQIVGSNLYLTGDTICNYSFGYENIQSRSRTKNLYQRFIRALIWCIGVQKLEYYTPTC